jgi:activating signal cointegrator 1
MKALSLWQPWATLIVLGEKRFETRSWSTSYRGPLLIHAAKSTKGMDACNNFPFAGVLVNAGYERLNNGKRRLPMGAALCIVNLAGVYRTEDVRQKMRDYDDDPQSSYARYEHHFGDYSPGRFAWQLLNLRLLNGDPVPMKGAQGLFDPPCPLCGRVLQWFPRDEWKLTEALSCKCGYVRQFDAAEHV